MQRVKFLNKIEEFLKNTGMSASLFGKRACSDPTFVFWLRKGREPREKMQQKVLAFMRVFERKKNEDGHSY